MMESVTTQLGHELQKFHDITCCAFATKELPKEAAVRQRCQSRAQCKSTSPSHAPSELDQPQIRGQATGAGTLKSIPEGGQPAVVLERKKKTFNLSTYKVHALADYVHTIRMFGTTDSYSTQVVRYSFNFISGDVSR
jgi:hypothetical protein